MPKVTFRKISESVESPKEPKPNEKDLNKTEFKGKFATDILKNPKKKIATRPEESIGKKLRTQKFGKQVVERNDFQPKGANGYNDALSDKDRQTQINSVKASPEPVSESGVLILSFEQFINEAEEFQSQYAPVENDFDLPAEEENNDDLPASEDNEEDDAEEVDDNWYGSEDSTDDESEPDTTQLDSETEPEAETDTLSKLNALNTQIQDFLKEYKAGNLSKQQYIEKTSELRAQRTELENRMNNEFDLEGEEENEFDDAGTMGLPSGELRF